MEKISSALKCVNCKQILSGPVFLPCGHMICQKHTQIGDDKIVCLECGLEHPNREFVIAKAVSDIIEAKLATLEFGPKHREATKSCDELKKQLEKNETILNDYDSHIFEKIGLLKNRVLLRSEELKKKIDEITQEIIDDLNVYQDECRMNVEKSFLDAKSVFKKKNKEVKTKLIEWSSALNELKFDQQKWKRIQNECERAIRELNQQLTSFEKELLLNKYLVKNKTINDFEGVQIDHVFNNTVK